MPVGVVELVTVQMAVVEAASLVHEEVVTGSGIGGA